MKGEVPGKWIDPRAEAAGFLELLPMHGRRERHMTKGCEQGVEFFHMRRYAGICIGKSLIRDTFNMKRTDGKQRPSDPFIGRALLEAVGIDSHVTQNALQVSDATCDLRIDAP